jgi:hypothetical protein
MSPNRVVALLTPLVFAPLAGAAAAWLAKHAPGVEVSKDDLQEIFIGGALIALAPAAQWLHGWQNYEARQAEAEQAVELARAAAAAPSVVDEEVEPAEAAPEPDELSLDALLALDELDRPLLHLDQSVVGGGDE